MILEFAPDYFSLLTLPQAGGHNAPGPAIKQPELNIRQVGDLDTQDGKCIPGSAAVIPVSAERNLKTEYFSELEYADPLTGEVLRYSLFIPEQYGPGRKIPLVCFIPDCGVCSPDFSPRLIQGQSGVIWSCPEEQEKRECFVLVPHYHEAIVNYEFGATTALDITIRLILSLSEEYSIDMDRIYGTGQSMGCMAMLEIGIRMPYLFTGMLLSAGQWDPSRICILAGSKMWVLVGEGDARAFDRMNACMESLEAAGAAIERTVWNGQII